MKYFLDSAKLDEIKFAYEHYCIDLSLIHI